MKLNEWDTALPYLESASRVKGNKLENITEVSDYLSIAFNQKGVQNLVQGEYAQAVKCFKSACKESSALGGNDEPLSTNNPLHKTYITNYANALLEIGNFSESFELFDRIGDSQSKAIVLNRQGIDFLTRAVNQSPGEAYECFKEAETLITSLEQVLYKNNLSYTLLELANNSKLISGLKLKNYEDALQEFDNILKNNAISDTDIYNRTLSLKRETLDKLLLETLDQKDCSAPVNKQNLAKFTKELLVLLVVQSPTEKSEQRSLLENLMDYSNDLGGEFGDNVEYLEKQLKVLGDSDSDG
jgi:tetratricopeptide (TPR) repeat protein